MAYLTYEEYTSLSLKKEKVSEDLFIAYEVYAEGIIDSFTFDVIAREDLMNEEYYSDKIKKAMAYQIDYMTSTTDDASVYAEESGKKVSSESVSVGETSESVSYSYDSGVENNRTAGGIKVAPLAVPFLNKVKAIGRQV